MKKTNVLMFLTLMTAGMLLGSYSQAGHATVQTEGLTKVSQLLQPQVIKALDSNGNGKGEITGIDPGAGEMHLLKSFISGNSTWSSSYDVIDSSGPAMTAALGKAISTQSPIVVTLWSPHWAFSKYKLTYLKDDVGVFPSTGDHVTTLARKGLNTTSANAQHLYNILTRFHWTVADCNSVMLAIENGATPAAAAQQFISTHATLVSSWVGSDNATDTNEQFTYGYVNWADTVANSNVLKLVLTESGFNIDFKQLDAGVVYSGLAGGSVDFTSSAWLPSTQANYWQQYNQSIDLVHYNLDGAVIGLVVPSYLTVSTYQWTSSSTPGFEAPLFVLAIVGLVSVKVYKKRRN